MGVDYLDQTVASRVLCLSLCNKVLSTKEILNVELARIWKETVVAYFNARAPKRVSRIKS
jgi:hypothetical protein